MALFRARLNSFLGGFAVASGLSLYLLRKDVWASHRVLVDQAHGFETTVESRLARVELQVAALDAAAVQSAPDSALSTEGSLES